MTELPVVPTAPPGPPRSRPLLGVLTAAFVAAVVAAALGLVWGALRPRLTETEVERVVLATLVEEAEASFLVTGTLTFVTAVEQTATTRLLPGLLDLPLGSRRATVRVPVRAAYGFDVRALRPEAIRLADDGAVEVDLPPLAVFSVEVLLERAEYRTEEGGWLRLRPTGSREETREALAALRPAVRDRAERHLGRVEQPRVNAARAVARMLDAPLRAAGMPAPRYRVRLGPDAVLTLDGAALGRGR